MKTIVVHIEGGRDKKMDVEFRKAFQSFFKEPIALARTRGIGWRNVLEGPRRSAYERFCYEVNRDPDNLHILLVDSEEQVKEFGKSWKHLREREGDRWECPAGADDTTCHLMVIAMEAWFFADPDPDTLEAYYGQKFKRGALSRRQNVEEIPKQEHLAQLEAATQETTKGRYHKTRHAPQLLERLDVHKVRDRAPHCEHLFKTLTAKIETA